MWRIFKKEWIVQKRIFLLIIINLAIGLYGFGLISVFRDALDQDAQLRAKYLLTADLSVSARRDLTPVEKEAIAPIVAANKFEYGHTQSIFSMVKNIREGKSRLVGVRGITNNYPLYGSFTFEDQTKVENAQKLVGNNLMWVSKQYVELSSAKLGDKVKVGSQIFTIDKIIVDDTSSSWQGVGVAPRVYVNIENLRDTDLLGIGSISWFTHYYKARGQILDDESLKEQLFEALPDPSVSITLPSDGSGQVARVMGYLTDYLGLVALMALFLSAIGSYYLFQNFINNRITSVGVLNVLGASKNDLLKLYSSFLVVLGTGGFILSFILLWFSLEPIQYLLLENLDLQLDLSLNVKTLVISFLLVIALNVFACLPLLSSLFKLPVGHLFSFQMRNLKSFIKFYNFAPLALVFWGLSIWQSKSFKMGSFFFLSVMISLSLMIVLIPYLLKFVEYIGTKLRSKNWTVFKLILFNFSRKKQSTIFGFVAISLGLLLVLVVNQMDQMLRNELEISQDGRPGLFLVDIQPEQVEDLKSVSKQNDFELTALSPMVRAKIDSINGKSYERAKSKTWTREQEQRQRFRNRGVNLSFAPSLNPTETIIDGREFTLSDESTEIHEISLENRYASRMGIKLNDLVTFDIMGILVQSKVVNLRRVKWSSFVPNFFILFPTGAIDDAPRTYLGAVGKQSPENLSNIQESIVSKLPNVSVINVVELIQKIISLFSTLAITLKFMAYLSLIMGGLVILSIALFERRNQIRTMLILETMGMSRFKTSLIVIGHFSFIYIIACTVAYLLSIFMSYYLARFYFDGSWQLFWRQELFVVSLGLVGIIAIFLPLQKGQGEASASQLLQSE